MNAEQNHPLISVVIPVYNAKRYLYRSVSSVIHQTYENIEIICIDDGSTDDSPRILQYLATLDDRVSIITKENQGQGKARNEGIQLAQGDFIFFLDSDDYIEP